MPSQIICRDAWIKGWTTICNRRIPELAFEWIPRHWSLSISMPPIALKRDFSAVYLTVNPVLPEKKAISLVLGSPGLRVS